MKSQVMLKLKLVDPPNDTLEHIANLCRRGRNVAIEDWLLRERGKPESPKQARSSTKIYHAITEAVPELSGTVASCLASQTWNNLKAKVDWRKRDESMPTRADAILAHEERPPWSTADVIPVPNKNIRIEFGDELALTIRNVLSKQPPLKLFVSLKGMSTGRKRIIRTCLENASKLEDLRKEREAKGLESGKKKTRQECMPDAMMLSDSEIVKKMVRNGSEVWSLYFCASANNKPVNGDTNVTLAPLLNRQASKTDRPFRVTFAAGGSWDVGDGRYLWGQSQRIDGNRKLIGYCYTNGNMRGHGRQKINKLVRKRVLQLKNVRNEFRRRLIRDVIKQCEREQAGVIYYREPTDPVKTKTWFATVGLEFDWTRFLGDLKNSAAKRGITVKTSKLKMQEVKDEATESV